MSFISKLLPGSTPPEKENTPEAVRKAVEKGQQLFLHEDVIKHMKEVGKVVDAFKKDDGQGLLRMVESYNQALGSEQIQIPDAVKASLVKFHSAVLDNLDATLVGEERNAAFREIMNEPSAAFAALGKTFAKDVEEKREQLFAREFMKENSEMQQSIVSILDNIKNLKVKYKYFEYKYMEMNIFLILFVQKVYQTMDEFVDNVLAFNKLRDANRENMMKETLRMMVEIMTAADLEMNPRDFENVMQMMQKVRADVVKSESDMEAKMEQLMKLSSENMSTFLNAFTGATKSQLAAALNRPGNAPGMNGGFLRSGSILPQAFYELDKSS